ncbi:MAG: hypothetical protein QNJ91_09810 [Gammaproteobacteria bacterium]|nr:hypothetical protein [Gammaproteobacteria bacterium]
MATLRSTEIYRDATVTIVAVDSSAVRSSRAALGFHLAGHREPVAIIVSGADGIEALDMHGQNLELGRLRREIADIAAHIASS